MELSIDLREKIKLQEWPSQLADLNPLENQRKELKIREETHGTFNIWRPFVFVWKNGPKSHLSNACD